MNKSISQITTTHYECENFTELLDVLKQFDNGQKISIGVFTTLESENGVDKLTYNLSSTVYT